MDIEAVGTARASWRVWRQHTKKSGAVFREHRRPLFITATEKFHRLYVS